MKKLIIITVLLIIIILGGMLWWKNGVTPVNSVNKEPIIFVVQKGDGVREISNRLKTKGLIRSRIVFFLLVKQLGLDKKIEAGDFRLNASMNAEEIAQNLTHGTLDIWVTIPEGKRGTEIAETLKEKIHTYNLSWLNILTASEGYLFPDTYLIPKDADINTIVSQMRNNFEKKYATLDTSKTKLSKNDVVILASLVEREAKFPQDRPLVASVLLNRMDIGMKLDIDATVQYALGYSKEEKNWWRKNLTHEDLKVNSLYNTYLSTLLPPSPIANPGIKALNAVVNPADTDFLYYISDKSGRLHFAKTLEGHNENIQKYGIN